MHSKNSNPEAFGYFGPASITWQLYKESHILTGGVRALLLQVAHPSVADGVARYSNFKADPFGRGYRTFAAMAMIYFGSKSQAEQTAQHLWRIHSAIRGELPKTYSATNPDLLLWVLATLTETTLQVYERMPLKGLPADWRERFYEESKVAAGLLGIPKEAYPTDLQAFKTYFKNILESDWLGAHPICRDVAQAIVQHRYAPKRLANLLATGWLPAPLCERLGLNIEQDAELKLARWFRRFYWFYRLIPRALRYGPAYHQAHYRIAKAMGEKPTLAGRFFNWLGKQVKLPLGIIVPPTS